MRETLRRSRSELKRRRIVIASADRVLITSLVGLFDGIGPLLGACTSEADTLTCLERSAADLLICTDLLESGDGPSLVHHARALRPELICLMLIQRPLRSTIEAATAAGCQGLCSRELVGNGHLLKAIQAIDSDAIYIDPGDCRRAAPQPSQPRPHQHIPQPWPDRAGGGRAARHLPRPQQPGDRRPAQPVD
jgi:DNA-binding NarL/FixJ family response regulator